MNTIFKIPALRFCFQVVILLFITYSYSAYSQNTQAIKAQNGASKGIVFFEGSWAQAQAEARKQNKPIFVDAYAAWCGPCKWMVSNTFSDPSVAEFYNQYFLNYKIDCEKNDGPAFAQQNAVSSYPTLLYFTPDGKPMHRLSGARGPKEFLEGGMNALNPDRQLFNLLAKLQNGSRHPDTLYFFALALNEVGEPTDEIINEYFKTQNEDEYYNLKNFRLIAELVKQPDHPLFERVMHKKDRYIKTVGEKEVDDYVGSVLVTRLYRIGQQGNDEEYARCIAKMKEYKPKELDRWLAMADYYYFMYSQDTNKQYNTMVNYVDNYLQDKHEELHTNAINLRQRYPANAMKLEKALYWASRASKLSPNPQYAATQANILYALGRREDARRLANKSLELSKNAGTPPIPEAETIAAQP